MSHPPVLTPERIDAMISGVAEVCFAAVEAAGQRLHAAPDMADFERAGRTLQTACRNLRQTIVIKQRFDREQAALAADRRREVDAEHKDAQRERDAAVGRHRSRVRRHFERVLWNEYEENDAQEMFEDVDERLFELADDAAFLETPVETLITRLAEEVGFAPSEDRQEEDPEERAAPDSAAENAEELSAISATSAEPPRPPRLSPPPEPIAAPPEPEPPPRPPDPPPPEPYIPPWEHPRRGRGPPGGSWMA